MKRVKSCEGAKEQRNQTAGADDGSSRTILKSFVAEWNFKGAAQRRNCCSLGGTLLASVIILSSGRTTRAERTEQHGKYARPSTRKKAFFSRVPLKAGAAARASGPVVRRRANFVSRLRDSHSRAIPHGR